ncbi:MAG: outer membrane beta-barrel protein [Flavobacteriaceae bacterium]
MSSKSSKNLALIIFFVTAFSLKAQFEFGVKAGLNYDSLGDLKDQNITTTIDSKGTETGYHVGFYGNLNLVLFYIRPEIQFTKINTSVENLNIGLSKIEVPILVGYKIFGPLSIFVGPSFQYILDEKVKGITLSEIKDNFTVSAQIGTRLSIGRFGLGIRYERGFTDNDLKIIGIDGVNAAGRINARPNQIILSASYKLKVKSKSSDEN